MNDTFNLADGRAVVKQLPNTIGDRGGVYCITCDITGESYIGSTSSLRKRLQGHLHYAHNPKYSHKPLYSAVAAHGWHNFTFRILERVPGEHLPRMPDDRLQKREDYWILALKPAFNDRIPHLVGSSVFRLPTPRANTYRKLRHPANKRRQDNQRIWI